MTFDDDDNQNQEMEMRTFQNFVENSGKLLKVERSEEAKRTKTEGNDGRHAALQCCIRLSRQVYSALDSHVKYILR